MEHCIRHMTNDASCTICGDTTEDIGHVLRGCALPNLFGSSWCRITKKAGHALAMTRYPGLKMKMRKVQGGQKVKKLIRWLSLNPGVIKINSDGVVNSTT